ncbi:SDR family oxidoreductase [Mariluticola halotolerans]|uniref:SDR family oxidoreductase n=1 Tax=Mariluticola halotolerans TaxID=2909283 RepID=UPI0026E3547D|nr:SDR family oxidoreductase [Mariluticola halotolerans]UJQ96132.1 SDR family oxidoreductase [Mariluticola halotolerans]
MPVDDLKNYPAPPYPAQQQDMPGKTSKMDPRPDHGEDSYRGADRLTGKVAIITGGDSGIGRAVAIAFAREGADVILSYLSEEDDAADTAKIVEQAGRKAVLMKGDVRDESYCQSLIDHAVNEMGRLDILVNNAAHQASFDAIEDISTSEWHATVDTNLTAMFHLCKGAIAHMQKGATIINTSSINFKDPSPSLLVYAMTKGAIANFTGGLAGLVADKGIRVNAVAPGPIWTPLIPATLPTEKVENFGADTPLGRAGQPAELAPAFVYLASAESSYVTGAVLPVTGGRLML